MTNIYAHFADVLARIATVSSPAQIWASVKEFAAPLGYTHLAGGDARRLAGGASDATFYTDAPMVPAAIDRTQAYASAPYVQRGLHSPETFLISDLLAGSDRNEPWFQQLADIVKRGEALAVPVYDGNEPLAGFIFAGEKPDTSTPIRALLQVLSHAAFARYVALQTEKQPATRYALTVREIQCLRSIAAGNTDDEAGQSLGISARTVRFHIDGAKAKLKVKTRIQAITKAIHDNIISV